MLLLAIFCVENEILFGGTGFITACLSTEKKQTASKVVARQTLLDSAPERPFEVSIVSGDLPQPSLWSWPKDAERLPLVLQTINGGDINFSLSLCFNATISASKVESSKELTTKGSFHSD